MSLASFYGISLLLEPAISRTLNYENRRIIRKFICIFILVFLEGCSHSSGSDGNVTLASNGSTQGENTSKEEKNSDKKNTSETEIENSKYNVSYELLGGSFSGETTAMYKKNEKFNLPASQKDGLTFLKWHAVPGVDGKKELNAGDEIQVSENTVFYAEWEGDFFKDSSIFSIKVIICSYGRERICSVKS